MVTLKYELISFCTSLGYIIFNVSVHTNVVTSDGKLPKFLWNCFFNFGGSGSGSGTDSRPLPVPQFYFRFQFRNWNLSINGGCKLFYFFTFQVRDVITITIAKHVKVNHVKKTLIVAQIIIVGKLKQRKVLLYIVLKIIKSFIYLNYLISKIFPFIQTGNLLSYFTIKLPNTFVGNTYNKL